LRLSAEGTPVIHGEGAPGSRHNFKAGYARYNSICPRNTPRSHENKNGAK
jgi:hypothetical protein